MPTTNTLTDQKCKAAKPREKPYKVFDGHGLFLFVSPAGGKMWRMAYRLEGKPQTATIGNYPLVTLAEARAKRDEFRKTLLGGEKPGIKLHKNTPTLWEASEAYWNGREDVSDSYRKNALRGIELHLVPALGTRSVATVTAKDLMVELMRLNAESKYVYLRKVRVWIGQVFDWAKAQGYRKDNPCAEIDPIKAFGRAKVVSFAALEQNEVHGLMERMALEADIQSVLACKFMALTWLRTNELRLLEWGDIDGPLVRIPKGRMKRAKDHLVPLSRQALEILAVLRARSQGSKYVFPNDRRLDRPMSENSVLYLLHRIGYKGEMTGHGWRTVGSTWANERGMDDDAIERQLSHVPVDKTRAVYNRAKYLAMRRDMLSQWADWLMPG